MSSVNNNSWEIVPDINQNQMREQIDLYAPEDLRILMQQIITRSFRAQFRDYDRFHQYWMGDIVVLAGTSTAGKTSIIQALKCLEPDRLEDGGDLRFLALDLRNIKKYHPHEVEILKNVLKEPLDIPKAIFSKERSWKVGISPQEKIKAEDAIQRIKTTRDSFSLEERERERASFQQMELEMMDDAFEYSRRGGNIIFDVLDIDVLAKHLLARNFDGPLRAVLIYCPFHELSSRMEKRNKEAEQSGELSNQRIGAFPLGQFSKIYSQREEGQAPFEQITRQQATKTFDENFDRGN